MRSLEYYVQKVRAVPARPVLIEASIDVDDYSAWWDLGVVFAQPDGPNPRAPHWYEHQDPWNGKALLHGHEVLGRQYYWLLLAMPPNDVMPTDHGIRVFGDEGIDGEPSRREPDLDGADRACADGLARALAEALNLPVWVEAVGGPYWPWWEVIERDAGVRPPQSLSRSKPR